MLDLQIGNMGGMAACMAIRLEESGGRLPHLPVLMLLDRVADLFLARRSHADGWLVKPLDAFRLRRAADALLAGGEWFELEPVEASMGDRRTLPSRADPTKPFARRNDRRVRSSVHTGVWRSLAARFVRDEEAVGSNPATPTTEGGSPERQRRTRRPPAAFR